MFALLYDYILFSVIDRFKLCKLAFAAIPVGILIYIILAQGAHLLGVKIPNYLYRNFLIEGFTLFTLGYWLHANKEYLRFSSNTLLLCIIITTVLSPVERYILGRDFGVNIVTFIQVTAVFCYCVINPYKGKDSVLTVLGLKYSMYVYIFHPAVWHLLEKLYSILKLSSNMIALYFLPILCVMLTILISVVFVKFKRTLSGIG